MKYKTHQTTLLGSNRRMVAPSDDEILSLSHFSLYSLTVKQKIFLPLLNKLNTVLKCGITKKKKKMEGNPAHLLWYTLVFAIIRTAN